MQNTHRRSSMENLDWEGASWDGESRGVASEKGREFLSIHGRRGDDELEVRPPCHDVAQQTEQDIRI